MLECIFDFHAPHPVKELFVLCLRSFLELRGWPQDFKKMPLIHLSQGFLESHAKRVYEQLLADSPAEVTYTERQQRGQLINIFVHFSKKSFVR